MAEVSKKQLEEIARVCLEARKNAYAPYSHFAVGAALLCSDGTIFPGCNVENASFGATNCAERTAVFQAISNGKRDFLAIAIAGGTDGYEPKDYVFPCGVCRQVLREFCDRDFLVCMVKSIDDRKVFRLEELLPHGFGGDDFL